MQYWLMKSEPDVFGIEHLQAMMPASEPWDGIRNYQARNFIRDDMKKGDLGFFYHSSCAEPGIVGIMQITRKAYPDPTQFEVGSTYFDSKSSPDNPRWMMVDVKFKKKFKRVISLNELKTYKEIASMRVVQKGSRLSIMPVTKSEWDFILSVL